MMKKVRWIFLVIFLSHFLGCNPLYPEISVMTFNIRLDVMSDGQHNWKHRRDAAAELIRLHDIDIVGTQEVLHNQLVDMLRLLPEYSSVGVGRKDGATGGEYSAILYKTDRFDVLSSGTFWLSDRPDEPGSVGWDAALERIVSWAVMKDKKTGVDFAVYNTHFDHRGQVARVESSKMIVERIAEVAGTLPVILTGDFNGTPESDPIRVIRESGFLFDSRDLAAEVLGPDWSFHGFGRTEPENRRMIDFIFVTEDVKVSLYHNIFEQVGNTFHSDHNPIFIKATIGGK